MKHETSEAMRERYDETRRAKVRMMMERRRNAKANGRGQVVLGFMDDILSEMGLTWTRFGNAGGASQQLVNHWKLADDVKLSRLQRCFASYKIELAPELRMEDDSRFVSPVLEIKKDRYMIEGRIPTVMERNAKVDFIAEAIKDNRRLAFLARIVRETGCTPKQFAKLANIDYGKLRRTFVSDDIKVSYIYSLADACGCQVVWRLIPREIESQTHSA